MLPDSADLQTLLSTFRRRLKQSVETISRMMPGRGLALFIDAIDNAEFVAGQYSEDCFPIKLLESLDTESVPGVKLIVSCRTERKPKTYARYDELELSPFSNDETASFLRARLKNVSHTEINVAQARSGGNPRVLEYLLKAGRGLLEESGIGKKLELDDLIQERIEGALKTAMERCYEQKDIKAFLAGLAVLPPPVPLEEYAGAHGIEISAIQSFASDLSPLLERTSQGLMFRDEPTETLVHSRYASSADALRRVANNLQARQDVSVYAARALPGLLHKLDDGDQLLALAFDGRIPSAITSTVGKRNVRYARLKAATLHAALKKNYNNLVHLLLELSTIAAVEQRGAEYILDHPDLVVAARDVDATRRLFEVRTGWPGTRHARLAIANTLSGDFEEANRYADLDNEWINHYRGSRSDDRMNDPGPERTDIAAIPFFMISQGQGKDAARYMERWRDWYAYEVCETVFGYAHLAQSIRSEPAGRLTGFTDDLSRIGALASALSFQNLSRQKSKELTVKLARRCKTTKLDLPSAFHRERPYDIQDGLRKAAAIALSLGLSAEAMTISLRAPHQRPDLWRFRDSHDSQGVFTYIFRVALRAAAKNAAIHEKDLLPKELYPICGRISKQVTGKEFIKKAKEHLSRHVRATRKEKGKEPRTEGLRHDQSQNAERFLNHRLEPLLALTKALSSLLGATPLGLGKAFRQFVQIWEECSKNRDHYRSERIDFFFSSLGMDIALFTLWARSDLKPDYIERFLAQAQKHRLAAHTLVRIVAILAQRLPCQELAGEQAIKAREMIEREDDVDTRASLFGALARAMLPANTDEAAVYFRDGLEQMDAIGSGDYKFTNELLLFASHLKSDELEERDFHTLSNICELNMGGEPEKFPWATYGNGLAKAAGLRSLAKLSRWDDRSKIALSNTLMPYLTGLLDIGKIDPKDALALNRLADPVEYYYASTKEFAKTLRQQAGPDPVVIGELINQFQDDNPELGMEDTVKTLGALAEEAVGQSAAIAKYLKHARKHYAQIRDTRNERQNYRGDDDLKMREQRKERDRSSQDALKRIATATDPTDEASLVKAIDEFNALGNMYNLKGEFFEDLRRKVNYRKRGQYIRNVSELEDLFYYWKFAELNDAKQAWAASSASLADVFKSLAIPLINAHADDLVKHGHLAGSDVKEISDLTGVPVAELLLELIKVFSRPDRSVSGSVWLAFATFVCNEADEGQGQLALARLLSSEASRLADNVVDGMWQKGLYPKAEIDEIAEGLIWRSLGSPYATDRWRGAHCIRSFARFGRWGIIDRLAANIARKDAGPFQASELPFFYLHARLWLLIALDRMALDYPAEVARYKETLLSFALENDAPHVLMRHFSARALLVCVDSGALKLPVKQVTQLRKSDLSPHTRLKKKIRKNVDFYSGRPDSEPKPPFEFHLDYDFHTEDVDNLSKVFGQPCWKVADLMAEIAHGLDPDVESMYESAGRETLYRRDYRGITAHHQMHGQQLGHHALFLAAGKLLQTYPVTDDWWYESDPWGEWLGRYALTRDDGLWLSDGTDRTPIDTAEFLLERKDKDFVITGDREKLLQLVSVGSRIGKELVVEGDWHSADNVKIAISSALVPSKKAAMLARKLTREEPITVWLPYYSENDYDGEHTQGDKNGYTPWIVLRSGEARLDEYDPYGVPSASLRPRLAEEFVKFCDLSSEDPFGRIWKDNRGRLSLRCQAWGRENKYQEDGSHSGTRLFCTTSLLKRILRKYDMDLLILVNLQCSEKETHRRNSKYTNTVTVVRVTSSLDFEYFEGRINHPYSPRF
ncbi:hypothetical protein [Thiolapillus sp.]|uniref:hypothetical protein n=2 Tax=Thiolapillus sp. TaxID=2017437 RepID=UPI003AF56115